MVLIDIHMFFYTAKFMALDQSADQERNVWTIFATTVLTWVQRSLKQRSGQQTDHSGDVSSTPWAANTRRHRLLRNSHKSSKSIEMLLDLGLPSFDTVVHNYTVFHKLIISLFFNETRSI